MCNTKALLIFHEIDTVVLFTVFVCLSLQNFPLMFCHVMARFGTNSDHRSRIYYIGQRSAVYHNFTANRAVHTITRRNSGLTDTNSTGLSLLLT